MKEFTKEILTYLAVILIFYVLSRFLMWSVYISFDNARIDMLLFFNFCLLFLVITALIALTCYTLMEFNRKTK